MELRLIVIFVFFTASVSGSFNPEFHKSINVCERNSPRRDSCLKSAVQGVFLSLSKGFPELNIPSLDPSITELLKLEYKDGNGIYGRLNLKSLKTYGYSKMEIKNLQTKLTDTKLILEMDTFLPIYTMEGNYKAKGKLYDFNINSKGYFNTTMKNVATTWKLIGDFEERDGEEYMKIKSFDMTPIPENLEIYADGVFLDPDLNRIAVVAINEFFKVSYRSLLPVAQNKWNQECIDLANKFFNTIPFRVLMPNHKE